MVALIMLLGLSSCQSERNNKPHAERAEKEDVEIGADVPKEEPDISLYKFLFDIESPDLELSRKGIQRLKNFTDCLETRELAKLSGKQSLVAIGKCINDLKLIQQSYQNAFFLNLIFGYSDCDINSILYLLAAEEYDLPIYGFFAPEHMFVAWVGEKDTIYWETLSNFEKDIGEFRLKQKLDPKGSCAGRLFQPADKSDFQALLEYNQALDQHRRGNLDDAIQACYRSIMASPEWISPWHAIARFFGEKGELDKAEDAFLRAMDLCPALKSLRKDLRHFYRSIGCVEEAELIES